jgi:oligopeptide/dipeptide ABC transporter ATP-binding protein
MTTLLQAIDVTKYFPTTGGLAVGRGRGLVKALDGVSVQVAEGETLGIVGESGSGKTTLAKLFLLLERPTAGSLLFDGQDVRTFARADYARYRRSVQAVFQDPYSSLNPRMRVESIVAEPLPRDNGMTRTAGRERVAEVLELVGLRRSSAALYPHEFSGGQRQRIALASALASYPQLIVLDEPVSALDVSIRAQIMNLLKDLQAQHRLSYLLIAHNLATVRYIAHQTAVMYLGQIVEQGATEALYGDPRHPYTRALFSAALPADPDAPREEILLSGEVPSPIDPPSGCRFHPRCPMAMDHCSRVEPVRKAVGPDHVVACHLY